MYSQCEPHLTGRDCSDDLEMANGCLDMIREELELLGLDMKGCPAMFYDDAIRRIAAILGRAAGFDAFHDVQRFIAEHEAEWVVPRHSGNP